MKRAHRLLPLTLLPLIVGTTALFTVEGCGGSDTSEVGASGSAAEVLFHGEANALPDFSYDTGPIPPGPVNVAFQISMSGGLTADAVGISTGPAASPTLSGKPGSGTFAIGVKFKLGGNLHVELEGLPSYDGPIPGIENVDVAFEGTTTFDPFLLGGKATATAQVPETKLPAIPLPAGIPGDLQITILAGSTLTSDFSGKCASVTAGPNAEGHYAGEATTSGTLKMKATITVDLPFIDPVDTPVFDVPIAATTVPIDLGTKPVPGGGAAQPGASVATLNGCSGVVGDGGSGGGGGGTSSSSSGSSGSSTSSSSSGSSTSSSSGSGGGTCEPGDISGFTPGGYHYPFVGLQGVCTSDQIAAAFEACMGPSATGSSCTDFVAANGLCYSCLFTDETDASWGAVVYTPWGGFLNVGGCATTLDPGSAPCAEAWQGSMACLEEMCKDCPPVVDASTLDLYQQCQAAPVPGGSPCAALVNDFQSLCGAGSWYQWCKSGPNDQFIFTTIANAICGQ